MKKIVFVCIYVLVFFMVSCGKKAVEDKTDEGNYETTELTASATEATVTEATTEKIIPTGETALEVKEDKDNRFNLIWEVRDCKEYVVRYRKHPDKQLDSADDWQDMDIIDAEEYMDDEKVQYKTDRLDSYAKYDFKIIVTDKGKEYESNEVSAETGVTALYSTIWPTYDLTLYSDSKGEDTIGSVSTLTALTVLDEKDGRFLVDTPDGEGYINSNYCMINLPDYLGTLCRYDITNSYCSIYTAHDYAIPGVTGTVISGYENVLLDDGTFLVPLLYPVAVKLVKAAENARNAGYVVKIYDSFRPYKATRSIYDISSSCLDYIVPGYTFSRITLDEYMNGAAPEVIDLSRLTRYVPEVVYASEGDAVGETVYDPSVPTYTRTMLGDGYNLGAFLAANTSRHNLGVAMDMTFETLDGVELVAQSSMHDLSFNSVQGRNNEDAVIIKNIMESAGFGMISSEWWHFQDNEATASISPPSVTNGVSVEGWKKTDKGWRYRLSDGSYYKNTTETINEKSYIFDINGYCDK